MFENDDIGVGVNNFIEIIQEKSNKSKSTNEKIEKLMNINTETKGFSIKVHLKIRLMVTLFSRTPYIFRY